MSCGSCATALASYDVLGPAVAPIGKSGRLVASSGVDDCPGVAGRRTASRAGVAAGSRLSSPVSSLRCLVFMAVSLTLRRTSRPHHIGIGRPYAGTCVILLVHDLDVRIANAITGELLRELTIDPNRDYQPRNPK